MQNNLIAVVGPTGAGKSDLGLAIVDQIVAAGGKAEIVNSDSMQFYRGMVRLDISVTLGGCRI